MKKVKTILISLFLITIITLGINYTFYKPAKFNSIIAAKLYKEPANTSFEDDVFYQCVIDAYNEENNTTHPYTYNLSDEELKTITKLDCDEVNIIDVTGIEKLTSLTHLDVSLYDKSSTTQIDLSKNKKLTELWLYSNGIKELNLSENKELTKLCLSGINLTKIDITNNKKLRALELDIHNITELDLSNNLELEEVDFYGNGIKKIKLSEKNTDIFFDMNSGMKIDIEYLDFGNNRIINPINEYIYTLHNYIFVNNSNTTISSFINNLRLKNLNAKIYDGDIEIKEGNISSENTVKIFDNNNNLVEEVQIEVPKSINGFKEDRFYECIIDEYNKISENKVEYDYILSKEQLSSIKKVECSRGIVSISGIEQLSNLEELVLYIYHDKTLDLSNNTKLKSLTLYIATILRELNLNNNLALEELYLEYVFQLNNLDISKNKLLKKMYIDYMPIYEINLKNNTSLTNLIIENTPITELELSQNQLLENVDVGDNELTKIDLSQNILLEALDISNNNLTNLDVNNNSNLRYLDVSDNELTEIDLSQNILLEELDSSYNQLTNIDLSNNIKLTQLDIYSNPFFEKAYVYKGKGTKIGNNIKIPSQLNWNKPTLTSKNENIATIDENETITGIKTGIVNIEGNLSGKYTTTSTVHVIEITSDKYVINEEDSNIYIGTTKNLENVKNNIKVSDNNVKLEINNNKLQVKHNDEILKEFDFIQIDFGKFKSSDNLISIGKNTKYEEFVDNITASERITYKIFKGNEEITNGNLEKGMNVKVYYNDKKIDSFEFTDEYIEIDESVEIDGEYLINISINTTVESILSKINTSGEIIIKNKDGEVLENNDLIGTGSIVSIELSEGKFEYTIIIHGDIDGDGTIKLPDVMKIANYVYKDKESIKDAYLIAADYDKNNTYGLSDIMGAARTLYN